MKSGDIILFVFSGILTLSSFSALGREPLTFEQRVKAQEAIEKVYYNHRIWPKENNTPKPAFEKMVSKETIEAKVTDYLKKSSALEKYWYRPITGEQLQAEMDRMAKGTKDPATLNELFQALDNDPYLISECLARPVLADRLVRNWYANDERFHKETREKAEEALKHLTPENFCNVEGAQYSKMTYRLEIGDSEEIENLDRKDGFLRLDEKEYERMFKVAPDEGKLSEVIENDDGFVILHTVEKNENEISIEANTFVKVTSQEWLAAQEPRENAGADADPEREYLVPPVTKSTCSGGWDNKSLDDVLDGREYHTAVWTGSEMIIWGGCNSGYVYFKSGGRYNPSTDTWIVTSTVNAPQERAKHTAVWTGSEMIVWGGVFSWDGIRLSNGKRYNPMTDTWTNMATTGAPTSRDSHTAVWTGSVMIVWGGYESYSSYASTGGRYNPTDDTWSSTSTGSYCPSARYGHTSVWTGTEMIVWGGRVSNSSPYYTDTGGRYNPASNSWTATNIVDAPFLRYCHTAVWTGTRMIIWGGLGSEYHYTGAMYDPVGNTWQFMSTGNVPSGRAYHCAVWTGEEMIVWGGRTATASYSDGHKFYPDTNTWSPISTTNTPSSRSWASVVWTGSEMIVWGGWGSDYFNSGGRYNPDTDSWTATSMMNCPESRHYHSSVWTGSEMIVWGGRNCLLGGYQYLKTGGRYNPSTDSWASTSTGTNCPVGRQGHVSVWTGTEMIIWGGMWGGYQYPDSGGKYNPGSDSWIQTSTTNAPYGREYPTAVWTGSAMIIWGGCVSAFDQYYNTGGRYNPSTDSWTATSTTNAPSARYSHTAVWTGTQMIVWGGMDTYYTSGSSFNSGGVYTPASDNWAATSLTGAPSARDSHTAVWTGSKMIVWGGHYYSGSDYYLNTGGLYDPAAGTWAAITTTSVPSARSKHVAVWTSSKMLVWGGYIGVLGGYMSFTRTGGLYDPSANNWTATSLLNVPVERQNHKAVWTGNSMIVWGGDVNGYSGYSYLCSGGVYYVDFSPSPPITSQPPDSSSCDNVIISIPASYTSYQWNLGGSPISGATSNTYIATISGSYTVSVTDSNGCSGTSEPEIVNIHPCMNNNTATDVSGCTDNGVLIEWDTPASWGDGGTGTRTFEVLRDEESIVSALPEDAGSYLDLSGTNGTTYLYRVKAINGQGSSVTTEGASVMDYVCTWNILYQSHGSFTQVTGDGDSYFEKGEKWSVPVTVTNSGNTPASNVTAILSGNGITVCNPTGSFGTIAAGGTASFTFEFLVASDFSPCAGNINFNLGSKACTELTPAGADETNLFSIQVGQIAAGVPTDLVLQPSIADTYVNQAATGNNYGTATTMYVQARTAQARRTLVQFDVSSVPAGSVVNSATLELYATAVTGGLTLNAHRITGTWTETGVTWANQPAYNSTADASIAGGTGAGWRIWNVAAVVQQWVDGTANYGLVVKASTETGLSATTYTFASKEYATTTYRPILRINYTPPTSINCDYVGSGECSVPLPGECAPGDTYENGQTWSGTSQSWPALTGAAGYKLYRGVQSGLQYLLTADNDSCLRYEGASTSMDLSADDPSGDTGRMYWYIVVGTNGSGEGPAGNGRIINSSGNCE